MPIKCEGCKAYCCRQMGKIVPEMDRGDGVCIYLNSDNRCEIYEDRPIICNTDKIYEKFLKNRITREEFDRLNEEACKYLQQENN